MGSCKAAILEALKAVPPAVEQFEIDASEEEAQTIRDEIVARTKAWDEEGAVIRPTLGKMPLFDMGAGYSTDIEVFKHIGVEFHIHTRSDHKEAPKVFKQMERNLSTGEEVPWLRCPLG